MHQRFNSLTVFYRSGYGAVEPVLAFTVGRRVSGSLNSGTAIVRVLNARPIPTGNFFLDAFFCGVSA